MITRRTLLLLSALILASGLLYNAKAEEASFIFGDSLVNAGNNNYLPTLSRTNICPNGIDLTSSGGTPTGRYTNGRTIGEELGQQNYALPFLAANTTGKAILSGVNYASGGGGILNATGRIFVNQLSMDIQVDYFNLTRKQLDQLDQLVGPAEAWNFLMKKSIFSITIGANDFLNNYMLPVLSIGASITQTPDTFIDHTINHLRNQLTVCPKSLIDPFSLPNGHPHYIFPWWLDHKGCIC